MQSTCWFGSQQMPRVPAKAFYVWFFNLTDLTVEARRTWGWKNSNSEISLCELRVFSKKFLTVNP